MAVEPNSLSLEFVEHMFARFLREPASVSADWRAYFAAQGNGIVQVGPALAPRSLFDPPGRDAVDAGGAAAATQERVGKLVRAYRVRGHMAAKLDPLGLPRPRPPELELDYWGLHDLDFVCSENTVSGLGRKTLREVVERLEATYCRSIGVQFMHIDDVKVRNWLEERMEATENRLALTPYAQRLIYTRLSDAVSFEEFIQRKYVGAKSFSLEGGESLIPLLHLALERAGEHGVRDVVLAMAHRGRLNVLCNIMQKRARDIFAEFEDKDPEAHLGRDDVKYHLGFSSDWRTSKGHTLHLSLCFNPSHLEFVNPVALGRVRAKQDRAGDLERRGTLGILIHGDAAFAGEGVVQETLNLSQLPAYRTGGTVHVVVNNQIGFTTRPDEGTSSTYGTDVAKMLQSPVFHVNGEDPEAVAQVVALAMDFRRELQRDVVIDMYCYRRRGHNEGDEPAFTQPVMYRAIAARKSVRDSYLERLLALGGLTAAEAAAIEERRRQELEAALAEAKQDGHSLRPDSLRGVWSGYQGGPSADADHPETAVERAELSALLTALTRLPEGFRAHPKIERWLEQRQAMACGEEPLDWSAGEALAFATLAVQGQRVRLTGQDSARGTFSHRHAVLHDFESGATYSPLQHLRADQAPVDICNSPLSEIGVLGFEYGYSLDCPAGLVAWEAQFGDFCNAAQVVVDQFVASAEDKWARLSGLVLLLPHGYEGMGPEHSSARLERFLMLCAEDNIQVAYPTTPAQLFHLLRRQVLRRWKKPLVVMTPKSLLRHRSAVSPLGELASGTFAPVLADPAADAAQVRRVLLCSGKIYYELLDARERTGRRDVAIVRLEQLYPLPRAQLRAVLAACPNAEVGWVQEEPENMGAWRFLCAHLDDELGGRPLVRVSRPESASPATGSAASHRLEQQRLLEHAFAS